MNYMSEANRKYQKHYNRRKFLMFGLPAHKSASGLITCPGAGKCLIGCYAQQGWYRSWKVKRLQERRLRLTFKGEKFVQAINQEIQRRKPKVVRIHDSGDFYDISYLERWVRICFMNPAVTFFTYSKMAPIIKAAQKTGPMPSNLFIVLSEGGIWDKLINQATDLFACVFSNIRDLRQAGFVNGNDNDLALILKGHKKIGLVYHGYNCKKFSTGGHHT